MPFTLASPQRKPGVLDSVSQPQQYAARVALAMAQVWDPVEMTAQPPNGPPAGGVGEITRMGTAASSVVFLPNSPFVFCPLRMQVSMGFMRRKGAEPPGPS